MSNRYIILLLKILLLLQKHRNLARYIKVVTFALIELRHLKQKYLKQIVALHDISIKKKTTIQDSHVDDIFTNGYVL